MMNAELVIVGIAFLSPRPVMNVVTVGNVPIQSLKVVSQLLRVIVTTANCRVH